LLGVLVVKIVKHIILKIRGNEIKFSTLKRALEVAGFFDDKSDIKLIERNIYYSRTKTMRENKASEVDSKDIDRSNLIKIKYT